MQTPYSTPLLLLLQEQLAAARVHDAGVVARNLGGDTIQVPGIGKNISNAYEQLRKAAESTEENLLLQRAIRRFYNRSVTFSTNKKLSGVGGELILELTHAGYLVNNTVSNNTAVAITRLAQQYVDTYQLLGKARVASELRLGWVLDLLSVETEALLMPHHQHAVIAYAAHQYYLGLFPQQKLTTSLEDDTEYEFCLYTAVHQALLKSDIAAVRYNLMRAYRQTPDDLATFVQFNQSVDKAYSGRLTQKLKQAVNKYGAPFRILRSMCDDRTDVPELLPDREAFLKAYDRQISKEYKNTATRLNKGLAKSIVFIFITKVSVGLLIEIPYDLIALGSVATLPLAVNLFFPPLYMASFKLGLHPPSSEDATAVHNYMDQILYTGQSSEQTIRLGNRPVSTLAKFFYTLLFVIPLALMVYVLSLLEFNIVQGLIFFVFISTASFLGFRLSRITRELELLVRPPSFSGAVRDFFYLPFIVMGQWISSKYSRLNIVAYILDVLVELPLKTVLRLVRQWTRFLSEKQDEMY